MGKSTISMAIFNSYVKWPEGSNITTELIFMNHHESVYVGSASSLQGIHHNSPYFI